MSVAGRWMPAWVVGAALAMLVVMPREASDVGVLVLLVLAPVLIASTRMRGGRLARELRLQLGVMALVPLVLTVSALASTNRYVGFVGRIQQHNGVVLWLACLGVAAVMAIRPRSGDIERLAKAISLCGAALSIAVLVDAAGADFGVQFAPEPSGFMTSSQALGEVLVLGFAVSLAWWLMPRRTRAERALAMGSALACMAALLVADARAALAAIALSAAGMALVGWRGRKAPVPPASFAGVTAGVVTGAATITGVVAATQESQPWWESVNAALTDRLVLWRSAMESVSARPLLGAGPDQFDAVLSWDAQAARCPR